MSIVRLGKKNCGNAARTNGDSNGKKLRNCAAEEVSAIVGRTLALPRNYTRTRHTEANVVRPFGATEGLEWEAARPQKDKMRAAACAGPQSLLKVTPRSSYLDEQVGK